MTTAVKRACDACHRRKVKCDGVNQCRNCSASQLVCTYNAIPQKKGPKGSRAKVLSEIREKQHQSSLSAKVQNRINGINSPPPSPNHTPNPGLLSSEMVKESIEFFFANMYPSMPILQRQRLEQQSLYMDQHLDTYCLLTSMCAFMMLQPGMTMPGGDPYSFESMPGANIVSSTLLLEETLRVRKGFDYMDSPSLNTLCTSYFLFGCFYGLDLHHKAWFHLREATTLMHIIGMDKERTYQEQYDKVESSRRRRLYWLLFITERAYALQKGRPLTLEASIELPSANDDPTDLQPHQLNGFIQQVNLFRPFDNSLVALWNKTKERDENSGFLQKQLPEVLPPYLNAQQAQLSEMQINQQWAKNTVWQLGVASGNGNESGMAYSYHHPVDITRDLLPMVTALPGNLGFNGLGLVEKLLSITCSLTEVLAMQPASRDPYAMGPREHLHQILNVLTVVRSGDLRFLPLLLSKVNDVLPKLTNPMLQNAPENAACNLDIFDGFGNAGMAQPPVFPTEEYDNKYAISRIDDLDSSSPNGMQSGNELSSPFDSTPSIMSPGVDMSHALQTDFTTMPDIVMSPLSHAPPTSISTSGSMSSQQSQHAQHSPMAPFPGLGSQIHGMNGNINPPSNIGLPSQMHLGQAMSGVINNGISAGLGQPLNGNSRLPPPQRTSSFAVGPPIRTVGDFHALQRANSDIGSMNSMGITSMGTELDFNTLPR